MITQRMTGQWMMNKQRQDMPLSFPSSGAISQLVSHPPDELSLFEVESTMTFVFNGLQSGNWQLSEGELLLPLRSSDFGPDLVASGVSGSFSCSGQLLTAPAGNLTSHGKIGRA
jgi:hypothetical protein